jgi:hypothetical protein
MQVAANESFGLNSSILDLHKYDDGTIFDTLGKSVSAKRRRMMAGPKNAAMSAHKEVKSTSLTTALHAADPCCTSFAWVRIHTLYSVQENVVSSHVRMCG